MITLRLRVSSTESPVFPWELRLEERRVWGWPVTSVVPCPAGSGVALLSNVEQLLRGVWKPETNEILHMSL
jgi:hypothetical protein